VVEYHLPQPAKADLQELMRKLEADQVDGRMLELRVRLRRKKVRQ